MFTLNDIVVTDVIAAFTVFSDKGRRATINKRPSYGISFCIDGQITYTHNGKQVVSDKNHAVILPKGQSYSLYGDKRGEFTVIDFECENFVCSTVRAIPIENAEQFIKDFDMIKSLSLFENNRTKIISVFYNIIYRLVSSSGHSTLLSQAINYIGKEYSDSTLTNEKIAMHCNISEVYLRKIFIKELGITPRQYLIDLRLQRAKQLLSEGILKVNAVAEICGFANPYHFCRLFKEKTGLTPSEYMKKNMVNKI